MAKNDILTPMREGGGQWRSPQPALSNPAQKRQEKVGGGGAAYEAPTRKRSTNRPPGRIVVLCSNEPPKRTHTEDQERNTEGRLRPNRPQRARLARSMPPNGPPHDTVDHANQTTPLQNMGKRRCRPQVVEKLWWSRTQPHYNSQWGQYVRKPLPHIPRCHLPQLRTKRRSMKIFHDAGIRGMCSIQKVPGSRQPIAIRTNTCVFEYKIACGAIQRP